MFKFIRDVASKIATKAIADDQIIFERDTGRLLIDDTTNRVPVKDRTAAKSMSYSSGTLTLKDADNSTLSTVTIQTGADVEMSVNTTNGHLYYGISDV